MVNFADFNRLASNFGAHNATWSMGDFDRDGIVNFADFDILASHFGQLSASEAAQVVAFGRSVAATPAQKAEVDALAARFSNIPEPGTAAVIAVLSVLMLRRRR